MADAPYAARLRGRPLRVSLWLLVALALVACGHGGSKSTTGSQSAPASTVANEKASDAGSPETRAAATVAPPIAGADADAAVEERHIGVEAAERSRDL